MEEPKRYGTLYRFEWNLTLSMEIMKISMNLWEICMDICLWVEGCKKPNPRIDSYGIKSMESFL